MQAVKTPATAHARLPLGKKIKRDLLTQVRLAGKHRVHYLFMAPYALIFIVFTILPVVVSIYYSFTYFNIFQPPRFIGLSNYIKLFFNDDIFITGIKNTLLFAAITGPISYILCLLFAWIINELPRRQRIVMTLLLYAPSISGGMYMIWGVMFSGDSQGYINGFLLNMGLIENPIVFLKNPAYMNTIIIIVVLWQSLGTSFLSFIAGLQGIDSQYYEAAALDGIKNRWQELWFVTLPMMKPQMMFGAVMSITASFGIGDVVTNLVGFPSVDYTSHTIINHLQDYGTIRYEMGYACAIATFLFLMMLLCNKAIQKLLSRVGV